MLLPREQNSIKEPTQFYICNMISISRLYLGHLFETDNFRYGVEDSQAQAALAAKPSFGHGHKAGGAADAMLAGIRKVHERPVVVWNSTNRCNLKCVHCYAKANQDVNPSELSTVEAKAMIDDLASYGAPVLLMSGGEPLVRHDAIELIAYARDKGMRPVLSTNGTLIDTVVAQELKDAGATYAGISLDGLESINDEFRGVKGSYRKALDGIHACLSVGLKVGLRFTINKRNHAELPGILKMLADEGIPRACFYHLVYAGRGAAIASEDLTSTEARAAMDTILDGSEALKQQGKEVELLTVANHCDGPYIYLRMKREGHPLADKALELMKIGGGNSSGVGIGCISWNGDVHPDQFWREKILGNIRNNPFSQIWENSLGADFMGMLKNKKQYVTGRCAACKFLDVCGGNIRCRAEALTGDLWAPDPACYLTDAEIGIEQ